MHLRDFWHFILLLLPRIRTVLAGRTGKNPEQSLKYRYPFIYKFIIIDARHLFDKKDPLFRYSINYVI